jgi:hypothetical protein
MTRLIRQKSGRRSFKSVSPEPDKSLVRDVMIFKQNIWDQEAGFCDV